MSDRKIKRLEWREIGESDWESCTVSWFNYCEKSAEHDTRIIYF